MAVKYENRSLLFIALFTVHPPFISLFLGRELVPYNHPTVCRAFLIGCCPYELVPDSRLQGLVSCRKTHEPAHKADFLKAQAEKDHFYDVDVSSWSLAPSTSQLCFQSFYVFILGV